MADNHIYTLYDLYADHIEIKFDDTIATSSILNSKFTLTKDNVAVVDPFKPINLANDYFSISRTLYLWFNTVLVSGSEYVIGITDLKTPFGTTVTPNPDTLTFTALGAIGGDEEGDSGSGNGTIIDYDEIEIEDLTILTPTFPISAGTTGGASSTLLNVVSVKPALEDAYQLMGTDAEGKITIEFDAKPAANFVNSTDFRLQKKATSGLSRWVDIATSVVAESGEPKVSIFLPSTDTVPVYSYQVEDDEAHTFWEPAYKYRLILSKSIGY